MTILSVLWFFLIFLLIAGYFVLDGFDLGVGTLYPFIAKTDTERAIVRRSIGPVWDGNEVWLLTAGGALFAAFPAAYATTFSGFYLAIMLVLFSLIVRAVSFEFWAADSKWRPVWNVTFFLGSALPALLFGVAIGNVIQGIPMDGLGNYIGIPLLGLITPFTLSCGLLGLSMFLAAGACWLALKAPLGTSIQLRAAKLRLPMQICALALFAVATVCMFFMMGGFQANSEELLYGRGACVLLFVIDIVCAMIVGRVKPATASAENNGEKPGQSDMPAFIFQSLAAILLVFLVAFSMFPNLVNASADSIGPAISIASAGASELSLTCMTIILCIGLPLVLVYHVIIYRTFRGRVNLAEIKE